MEYSGKSNLEEKVHFSLKFQRCIVHLGRGDKTIGRENMATGQEAVHFFFFFLSLHRKQKVIENKTEPNLETNKAALGDIIPSARFHLLKVP